MRLLRDWNMKAKNQRPNAQLSPQGRGGAAPVSPDHLLRCSKLQLHGRCHSPAFHEKMKTDWRQSAWWQFPTMSKGTIYLKEGIHKYDDHYSLVNGNPRDWFFRVDLGPELFPLPQVGRMASWKRCDVYRKSSVSSPPRGLRDAVGRWAHCFRATNLRSAVIGSGSAVFRFLVVCFFP